MKGEGNDVTQEHLDESTLLELRDDLINNWGIHYSNPDYRPCKNVSGGPVDRKSNRQTYKKHSPKFHYSRSWWILLGEMRRRYCLAGTMKLGERVEKNTKLE
jgi:hypothetical protein